MEDYQERVLDEKKELEEKAVKLENFIYGDTEVPELKYSDKFNSLKTEQKSLMILQLGAMYEYLHILKKRIELF